MFQLFEDEDPRAFAHHESVAITVPWTAGFFGFVIARGERTHGGESADADRSDGGFSSAGNHHIGIATLNDAKRIADGVCAGGACGAVASFGPFALYRIETCPAARFTMAAGIKNGEIFRGPPSISVVCSRSMMSNPPMPEPM